MSKPQAKTEDLSKEDVKGHIDAAKIDPDPKVDPKVDPETAPSVVAEEKYYRCKKPTTYMKDHSTGLVFDGDARVKSPLTGFLQSQIETGKMEECEPLDE